MGKRETSIKNMDLSSDKIDSPSNNGIKRKKMRCNRKFTRHYRTLVKENEEPNTDTSPERDLQSATSKYRNNIPMIYSWYREPTCSEQFMPSTSKGIHVGPIASNVDGILTRILGCNAIISKGEVATGEIYGNTPIAPPLCTENSLDGNRMIVDVGLDSGTENPPEGSRMIVNVGSNSYPAWKDYSNSSIRQKSNISTTHSSNSSSVQLALPTSNDYGKSIYCGSDPVWEPLPVQYCRRRNLAEKLKSSSSCRYVRQPQRSFGKRQRRKTRGISPYIHSSATRGGRNCTKINYRRNGRYVAMDYKPVVDLHISESADDSGLDGTFDKLYIDSKTSLGPSGSSAGHSNLKSASEKFINTKSNNDQWRSKEDIGLQEIVSIFDCMVINAPDSIASGVLFDPKSRSENHFEGFNDNLNTEEQSMTSRVIVLPRDLHRCMSTSVVSRTFDGHLQYETENIFKETTLRAVSTRQSAKASIKRNISSADVYDETKITPPQVKRKKCSLPELVKVGSQRRRPLRRRVSLDSGVFSRYEATHNTKTPKYSPYERKSHLNLNIGYNGSIPKYQLSDAEFS